MMGDFNKNILKVYVPLLSASIEFKQSPTTDLLFFPWRFTSIEIS